MRTLLFRVAFFLCVLAGPAPVWAQLPMPPATGGSTQTIDDIRRTYGIHLGPFYVKPGLLLKELGVDTNVFNQAGEQKSDFTLTITPQADLAVPLARRGLVKVTFGVDGVYYANYVSERSIDPQLAVRAEAYAQRLTLFVEESYLNTRQRPNYEIDLRSRHLRNNIAGGLAVRFTPKLSAEVARGFGRTRFDGDAFFEGQRLSDVLDRNADTWLVAARHKLTALTTLGLRYERQHDRFPVSPVRNTDSFLVMPGVELKPRALINGSAWVGFRRFTPRSELLPAYSGIVSRLAVSHTLLGATTFGVTYDRDVNFSVDVANPYYVDNSPGVYVRRALGGRLDVIANAARHRYTYTALTTQDAAPRRVETTHNYGVNLGYRLKRQTRIGFGASYWTRDSTAGSSRAYDGLRFGTTVTYGF